jgi:hypothetical protein
MTTRAPLVWAFAASLLMLAAEPAVAQMDGTGKVHAPTTKGLGQAFPQANNLSLDPAWRVYAFERDGVRYLQMNDASGSVHAAIGIVGDTLWTLPLGIDADRVSTPEQPLPLASAASWNVVYRSADVEIKVYADAATSFWTVAKPSVGTP